jgi:GT2 family glycosyltransferase
MRRVVFEPVEPPAATVVVLAWRLSGELLDCLEGLARGTNVVVVLNGAEDSVRDAIRHVEGATVVEAPVNLGFARGCNLGVTRARGEFLVFLNDDAKPAPDWLDSLIASARAHPDAGAIASRVVNPDGSLQEAGGRILASGDGIAMQAEPDEPRPVDYGGAEALLVRRELFVELGGFDQAYDPAYFEDADLCLRLRAAGWSTVYEPAAVVVHHQSLSTDGDSEWRTFAYERSRAVFLDRWGPLLSSAPGRDDPPSALLPVPPGYGLDRRVAQAADHAALETQRLREFNAWLTDRLRSATATIEELKAETAELHAHTEAQERELSSLRSAPLHALVRRRLRGATRPPDTPGTPPRTPG